MADKICSTLKCLDENSSTLGNVVWDGSEEEEEEEEGDEEDEEKHRVFSVLFWGIC